METKDFYTNEEEEEPPGQHSKSENLTSLHRKTNRICKFPISSESESFRKAFFPYSTKDEWNDWHWQLRNRIRRTEQLSTFIKLTMDEMIAILRLRDALPLAITPYYAGLISPHDPSQPLRRTVIPVTAEYTRSPGEADDPLDEDQDSPVEGVVHRYPDRALFLVTNFCSTHCRYCTRSRFVCAKQEQTGIKQRWQRRIEYIESTPQIRDVLVSGGDPLTLSDEKLEWLLSRLRKIPHVELIRIGTKVPVALPQRITTGLTRLLKRYHPLWMSIHFTHPEELTVETSTACARLADAGIPLGSQTVLLSGINDNVKTMKTLMQGLVRLRVKPYYLYQCDPICGSGHFRTPVEKGLEIIEGLRGHTSGYAVPTYVIDAPGGGGKIPLLPEYLVSRTAENLILRNYEGRIFRYPDCSGSGSDTAGNAGRRLRIGLTFDLRDHYLALGYSEEQTAEFDSQATIDALAEALTELGHIPDLIGNATDLTRRLVTGESWDLVFNIAEGMYGFGREALIPALLDNYEIPYTFSDPCVMAVCLHKSIAKSVLREAGLPTANFTLVRDSAAVGSVNMTYPLFAKPVAEGTGKGIDGASKITDSVELKQRCDELLDRYRQPVLLEEYLPGREFTVGILGTGGSAEVLGTLEIIIRERGEQGAYSYLNKEQCEQLVEYRIPKDETVHEVEKLSLQAWRVLDCHDAGRIDIRLDAENRPAIIEANPLAGMHPTHSDLPMIATATGMSYKRLVEKIIISARRRAFRRVRRRKSSFEKPLQRD